MNFEELRQANQFQFTPDFLKGKEVLKVSEAKLPLEEYFPWLEEQINKQKLVPIEVQFSDGTSKTLVMLKVFSEDEVIHQMEVSKRCKEFGINYFPVAGSIEVDNKWYFITEFVPDAVPSNTLSFINILDFELRLDLGIALADKLHEAGICHGDYAPLNIGYSDIGLYIYDFTFSELYEPGQVPLEKQNKDKSQLVENLIGDVFRSGKVDLNDVKKILIKNGLDEYVPQEFMKGA